MFRSGKKIRKGFTLIEVLLTIGLISIVVGVGAIVSVSYLNKSRLETNSQLIASALRRAHSLAFQMKEDDDWGVDISGQQLIIFRGNDFNNRDQNFDELVLLNSGITYTGPTQFVFEKFNGGPVVAGSLTLTNTEGDAVVIEVTEEGGVFY